MQREGSARTSSSGPISSHGRSKIVLVLVERPARAERSMIFGVSR
jgi:hypothetical protein